MTLVVTAGALSIAGGGVGIALVDSTPSFGEREFISLEGGGLSKHVNDTITMTCTKNGDTVLRERFRDGLADAAAGASHESGAIFEREHELKGRTEKGERSKEKEPTRTFSFGLPPASSPARNAGQYTSRW